MSSISPFRKPLANYLKRIGNPVSTNPAKASGLKSLERDTFQPKFGTNPAENAEKAKEKGWFNQNVWSRIKASSKGAMKGTFTFKNWKWDLGYVGVGFLATLPFAMTIPGSHLILLPILYVGGRLLNGMYKAGAGLIKPEWVK